MSRIGNKAIHLPAGVTVNVDELNNVVVTGPKGELKKQFDSKIKIVLDADKVVLTRPTDNKEDKMIHGTTRALLNNMVVGVSEGFKKHLVIEGVGYRAQLTGNTLVLNVGFSHTVDFIVPEGLKVELPKNTEIIISGADKELVGEFTANVRKVRKPEPYKGKGIRYIDEHVRRKEGKRAKK